MKSYTFKKTCRICKAKNLVEILDLQAMPPANAFLDPNTLLEPEEKFPLIVYFCPDCTLVQLCHVVDPTVLFGNYHYETGASTPLVAHFEMLADKIATQHITHKENLVVEIGSNDGSLLARLKDRATILGVDPAESMATLATEKGVPTLSRFFNKKVATEIVQKYGHAKIIIANNVLAHIDDLHSVFTGIKTLLSPDGKFIFEAHWVGNLIGRGGFDQIYHEHLCYFSLIAIKHLAKQFGLSVLDCELVKIHGESIRVTLGTRGVPKKRVATLLAREKKLGLHKTKTFVEFAKRAHQNKEGLSRLLRKLKSQKKMIVGYGAPAKGNTLLNFCGITQETIDFITDTTPRKQGRLAPGTKIPIAHPRKLLDKRPDYVVLLSWNYAPEILAKEQTLRDAGVKFIIPVPKVKIV